MCGVGRPNGRLPDRLDHVDFSTVHVCGTGCWLTGAILYLIYLSTFVFLCSCTGENTILGRSSSLCCCCAAGLLRGAINLHVSGQGSACGRIAQHISGTSTTI